MDCIDNQQPKFKHYCKVCKKGFICGRALGGHMRAHGIGYENFEDDDDDDHGSDWDEKLGGSDGISNRRMYKLRTNPNRLKSCRSCENCGKEFLCWKSFLEHGKCSSNDGYESPVPSPESEDEDDGERNGFGWSKRKRAIRTKVGDLSSTYNPPSEDDDIFLATCLVQLANTIVEPMPWQEESCSSDSHDERRNPRTLFGTGRAKATPSPKGLFECKACKKVFNSHQALGGHRASHKKVKGCFAAKQDQYENSLANSDIVTHEEMLFPSKPTSSFQFQQSPTLVGAAKRKSKVHECSICHRVFASGQALGGHKRCHWIVSNSSNQPSLANYPLEENIEPMHHHHVPHSTNLTISMHRSYLGQPKYEDDNNNNAVHKVDDEANSKLKVEKLSDLKELGTCGNPSPWLQIGFGSTTETSATDA